MVIGAGRAWAGMAATWMLAAGVGTAQAAPERVRTLSGCSGCEFGWGFAAIEDLDGDGRTDLVVGAPSRNDNRGRVYVYSGATGAQLFVATLDGSDLGYGFNDAGDVDGDGRHDVVASGQAYNGNRGTARVYSGRTGQPLLAIDGATRGGFFGSAVAGAGDVDGDGRADVLVGAQGLGTASLHSGATGALIRTFTGNPGSRFGAGVGRVDDVDGDGADDLIIGAPTDGAGTARVYSARTGAELLTFTADSANGAFGEFMVYDAGDVNADGHGDIYVGAYNEAGGNGAVYVYDGRTGARLHKFSGSGGEGMGPGRAAGDVDGDGHDDVIVGSYTANVGAVQQAGRVRVYSGRDGSILTTLDGPRGPGTQFGFDALALGDLDGDDRIDFAVSSAPAGTVDIYAGDIDRPDPFAIGYGVTGAWYETRTAGQGFTVQVLPDRQQLFVGWFTYTPTPSLDPLAGQRWLTAQGGYTGTVARLDVFLTEGGTFDAPGQAQTSRVGTLEFDFDDCTHATARYVVQATAIGGPAAAGQPDLVGEIDLQRLTPSVECPATPAIKVATGSRTPKAQAVNFGITGAYYDPASAGQGLVLEVLPSRTEVFAVWYLPALVDSDVSPRPVQRWLTAQGTYSGSRAELVVSMTTRGAFDAVAATSTFAVGTLVLDFDDCNHASASYVLESGVIRSTDLPVVASLSGSIPLVRLTPDVRCASSGGGAP